MQYIYALIFLLSLKFETNTNIEKVMELLSVNKTHHVTMIFSVFLAKTRIF